MGHFKKIIMGHFKKGLTSFTKKLFTKIYKNSKIVVVSGYKWQKVGDFYVYGGI